MNPADGPTGQPTSGSDVPLRIAVAGASGYVGRALVQALAAQHQVVALGRSPSNGSALVGTDRGVQQQRCDLFSQRDIKSAIKGADVAVYLVHSMQPSARLTQASFQDLDLILADNFARAAAEAGVKKIVYLGGILPETRPLSLHLQSRLEVEEALSAHGVPVVALRAGLVVGPNGSSFLILQRLVERLPAMILPAWSKSRTQPIALSDVVALLRLTVVHHENLSANYDIAGADVLTYREMIARVAEALGRRSPLVDVPWFSPRLSCLWISLVSGQPYALVAPLVESLLHEMLARDTQLMDRFGITPTPFGESLSLALTARAEQAELKGKTPTDRKPKERGRVRSVQRLPRPENASASDVAEAYMKWLPRALFPLVNVRLKGEKVEFRLRPVSVALLVLERQSARSHAGRELFVVTGGLLADRESPDGRLEFRITPDGRSVLAALHEYKPRLPWCLYRFTQAWVHLWVMRAFGRYLGRADLRKTRNMPAT